MPGTSDEASHGAGPGGGCCPRGGRSSRGGVCVQHGRGEAGHPAKDGSREGGRLGRRPTAAGARAGAIASGADGGSWSSRGGWISRGWTVGWSSHGGSVLARRELAKRGRGKVAAPTEGGA